MKRKLIDYDVFKKIEENSLSQAERELILAEDVLAHALDLDGVNLHCFGEDHVVYETLDETFLHASYDLNEDAIVFENIEELIVDEDQERVAMREMLNGMVDELLEGNEAKADSIFEEFITAPVTRRTLNESKKTPKPFRLVAKKNKSGKVTGYEKKKRKLHPTKKQKRSAVAARVRGKKKHWGNQVSDSEKSRRSKLRKAASARYGLMKENFEHAAVISNNVLEYCEMRELGPAIQESVAKYDERGNVVALRVPTSQIRNEGKILSFNWKTLNTDIKMMRDGAKVLGENVDFCKAVAELKRHNAFSNSEALDDVLESIVSQWPDVLYLTQTELAEVIGEALEQLDVKNYDDQVCDFMAEGILRKAHENYEDRVTKILRVAGAPTTEGQEDTYAAFQDVVHEFFPTVDGQFQVEMSVFYDLYNSIRDIHKEAVKAGDELLAEESDGFLRDLYAVCDGQIEPDITLAEEAAEWLYELVETNLETSSWNPSNSVHTTISGDHPKMAQLAKHSYSPSSDFDGSGGGAQVSDGKSYRNGLENNMRNNSWGNIGGETFPELKNPYVPKPFGDYTMKGEKGIDKDTDNSTGQWSSGDTWPNLQNPYVPKAETPQSYKMNKGKEDDLVVDN